MPPGNVGTFPTGKSFWQFQLHYGGPGYEHFGTVAGMGNSFTELTGWQPGDPAAWRDSIRYALNRAKTGGWGPWYGAAAVGITGFTGIDRTAPWDANAERWDYEDREPAVPTPRVTYDTASPAIRQNDPWSCAPTAARWAMRALGRQPTERWFEDTMLAEGVVTRELGLMDATGAGLAAFVQRHYGEYGYAANHEPNISWDWIVAEGEHRYPVLIGGRGWNHWAAVRDYDAATGTLRLMNPAPGWMGVGDTMTRAQFDALGPFSAVRIWHPDLLTAAPPAVPEPEPPPLSRAAVLVAEIEARLAELKTLVA